MKKLLLAMCLATGFAGSMAAQELQVLFQGEPVENGGTVVFKQYEVETQYYDEGDVHIEFSTWKVDPKLMLVSDVVAPITVSVNSTTGVPIQLCAGGQCQQGVEITKAVENLVANTPLDLQLDWLANTEDGTQVYDIPEMIVDVEIYYTEDPSNALTFTLEMGGVQAVAAVEELGAGQNLVKLNGRQLEYDLPASSQINVYSLSGKNVINANVAGAGSLSLEGLSKGIYIYKVSGKYNKAQKFIIK